MKRHRTDDDSAHRRALLHHAAHVEASKLGVRRKKTDTAAMRPITLPRVRFLERPEPEDDNG